MLLSLVLFGSRARGDSRITSDVDLLGVVEQEAVFGEIDVNGASFYQYSLKKLEKMSLTGDLFMLHLAQEAKIIHDTGGVFEQVCGRFRYKKNYELEVLGASALMMYIIGFTDFHESAFLRRRLIWCLRTILTARSAERRTPCFSSQDLAEFSADPNVRLVIDNRYSVDDKIIKNVCLSVYCSFGASVSNFLDLKNNRDLTKLLNKLGGVPKSTLRIINSKTVSGLVDLELLESYN